MIKVYFSRSSGESIFLDNAHSEDDVFSIINNFLNDHNYKSYYIRTWNQGGKKWYDVGSHTEFFYSEGE